MAEPQTPALEDAPRDLYPASDLRFVLVEIGKLGAKVDRLVGDLEKMDERIGGVVEKTDARIGGIVEKMDARIGGIVEKMDARIGGIFEKMDGRISGIGSDVAELKQKISFVQGAVWVIGILGVLVGIAVGWYITGKITISVHPGT